MDKNREHITTVLFDWDFTLAYTLQKNLTYIERIAVLFQNEGVHYTIDDFRAARHDLLKDIALGIEDGTVKPQTKQDIILFYQQFLTRLGHADTSQDLAYRIYAAYGRLPTFLYDDVLPTLKALQNQQIKLGILSNHTASVRASIEKLVGQFIPPEYITISEEVDIHKPQRAIFTCAAERLQTPPNHCLYVGDNLHVDAIGAVEQGGYGFGLWLDRLNQGTRQDIPANVVHISVLQQVLDFVS